MKSLTSYINEQRPKSMADIAKDLGVSRPYLYQLANGERTPSIQVAVQIATATDQKVPVGDWPNLAKIQAAFQGGAA